MDTAILPWVNLSGPALDHYVNGVPMMRMGGAVPLLPHMP